MRFRLSLSLTVLALSLAFTSLSIAQSGSSQRTGSGSSGSSSMSIGGDGLYYVDEVGIRIATESAPFEGFINENEYILGAQDIISVEVHGTIPMTWRGMVVNAEGYLIIPTIGNVHVGDITLAEAKNRVREAISQRLQSDRILVTLEMPKPVNVHVVGDLSSPGRYTFPAHSRVDYAVINLLVGFTLTPDGDSDEPIIQRRGYVLTNRPVGERYMENAIEPFDLSTYNLRNMLVRHRDGKTSNTDVFAYLNGGVMESNPYLRDGDVIVVHKTDRYSPKISVSGAVKSGFTSDYRNDDTIQHLLHVSGGYDNEADTTHFFVARLMDGKIERIRIEGSAANNTTFIPQPNDRIIVPRTERSKENHSVWISGEIMTPGNYPIIDGVSSVIDVIATAGSTTDRSLLSGVFIERVQPNEFLYSYGWAEQQLFERTGDQYMDGLDYIRQEKSLSSRFIFIDIRNEERASQIRLRNGDRIHVPSDDGTVLVMGQVNKTGYYPIQNGLSVQDYITQAGGYAFSAQEDRTFIVKSGSREWYRPGETSIESGDIIFIDRIPTDTFQAKRTHEMQRRQQRLQTYQITFSTVATLVSIVLTYIALSRN